MSKKYDEYCNHIREELNKTYLNESYVPMIPKVDKDLEREIRDKQIISTIKLAMNNGFGLTDEQCKRMYYSSIDTTSSRDNSLIAIVRKSIEKGIELSYGDILIMLDNDDTEKEYEATKEKEANKLHIG